VVSVSVAKVPIEIVSVVGISVSAVVSVDVLSVVVVAVPIEVVSVVVIGVIEVVSVDVVSVVRVDVSELVLVVEYVVEVSLVVVAVSVERVEMIIMTVSLVVSVLKVEVVVVISWMRRLGATPASGAIGVGVALTGGASGWKDIDGSDIGARNDIEGRCIELMTG